MLAEASPNRGVLKPTGLRYPTGAPARCFTEDGLVGEPSRLSREDLEAMRQEFGADEWHAHGRPLGLDDDLHQVRQIEWAGFTLNDWAKARGVPLTYAKALRRFLRQH